MLLYFYCFIQLNNDYGILIAKYLASNVIRILHNINKEFLNERKCRGEQLRTS